MSKYLAFFKISLKKSLEYRARAFVWMFWDIGPALIMLFFWLAVFKTREQVAGYDYFSMVTYYLGVLCQYGPKTYFFIGHKNFNNF